MWNTTHAQLVVLHSGHRLDHLFSCTCCMHCKLYQASISSRRGSDWDCIDFGTALAIPSLSKLHPGGSLHLLKTKKFITAGTERVWQISVSLHERSQQWKVRRLGFTILGPRINMHPAKSCPMESSTMLCLLLPSSLWRVDTLCRSMLESDAIVKYLFTEYGDGVVRDCAYALRSCQFHASEGGMIWFMIPELLPSTLILSAGLITAFRRS